MNFVQRTLAALLLGVSALAGQAATITFFHNDVSGTPLLATDQSGKEIWRENYRPYGERLNLEDDSASNKLSFHGKPYDPATGLSYMGARYYHPAVGRFMGMDPASVAPDELQSFNRYAYANNNPYRFVDPDGHSPIDVVFLAWDIGKLGVAMYTGVGVGAALADVALSTVGVISPVPGTGQALKVARAAEHAVDVGKAARGASQLAANKARGAAFETAVASSLRSSGQEVSEQITVKTASGVRTRVDLVAEKDGVCRLVECKSSATAPLTKNQKKAFPEIEVSGAVVVGKGSKKMPGGTRIEPTKVDIVRPE